MYVVGIHTLYTDSLGVERVHKATHYSLVQCARHTQLEVRDKGENGGVAWQVSSLSEDSVIGLETDLPGSAKPSQLVPVHKHCKHAARNIIEKQEGVSWY